MEAINHHKTELSNLEQLPLDEVCRIGAEDMLRKALAVELECYLRRIQSPDPERKKATIVRNGYHKVREVAVGGGMISVRVPRTRNRNGDPENFASALLPSYMRRSPKVDEVLPLLYLKGISTGQMQEVAEQLYGDTFSGGSAASVSRLKEAWQSQHTQWQQRDLSDRKYCYIWVDGIHFNVRLEDDRLCILVAIGALSDGRKELIAVESGYRESGESWSTLLRTLRERG